jgi:hypothetical protein
MLRKSSSPFTGRRVRSSGFGVDLAAAPHRKREFASLPGAGVRRSPFATLGQTTDPPLPIKDAGW